MQVMGRKIISWKHTLEARENVRYIIHMRCSNFSVNYFSVIILLPTGYIQYVVESGMFFVL